MKALILAVGLLQMQPLVAQPPMRPSEELVDREISAWPRIEQQIRGASNQVEVLQRDPERVERVLQAARLTAGSTLGAVVQETAGILVDDGWLRILGSGNERLNRSYFQWSLDSKVEPGQRRRARGLYLVADDILGGLYALNAGHWGIADMGTIYYFSPSALKWQSLEMDYDAFLNWALNGDLDEFYGDQRWKGWRREVSRLGGNEAYSFQPFLWSGTQDIAARQRDSMPVEQLYFLHRDGRHDAWGFEKKW